MTDKQMIELHCRKCKRSVDFRRTDFPDVPSWVARIEHDKCNICDDGDFSAEHWIGAEGKQPDPDTLTNGQQNASDYTAGADLARNIASYVSDQTERRNCYLAARNILNEILAEPDIEAAIDAFMNEIVVDGNGGLEHLDDALFSAIRAGARRKP